jgi:hypothetical protein
MKRVLRAGNCKSRLAMSRTVADQAPTEVRVHRAIREGNDRGFRCGAIADAWASYFPAFHRVGLETIEAQGGSSAGSAIPSALLARSARRRSKEIRHPQCRHGRVPLTIAPA